MANIMIGTGYKTLSVIKDGARGPAGLAGAPSYTWIRYADDAEGNGMSESPVNKAYIGIATNKTTPEESDSASEYSWSLIKGADGVGTPGKDGKTYYTWIKYADTPTTGMSNSPEGKDYMGLAHNKETNLESDRYEDYSWSLIRGPQGLQGLQGNNGKEGIPGKPGNDGATSYFHIKYSAVEQPTLSSQISETPNTYIGTYVDFEKEDSEDPIRYTWARFEGIQGPEGDKGIPGDKGENGATSYLHIKYSNKSKPQTAEDMNDKGGNYIGQYVDFVQEDSDDPNRYTWSRIKGDQGVQGNSLYTWIMYADDEKGSAMTPVPANKEYIGIASNKKDPTPSKEALDYQWTKLKGDKGIQGNIGPAGESLYTWIKYADDESGKGMSDNPKGKKYIGIAANQKEQQEGTDASAYKWTLIQGPQGITGGVGPAGKTLYTWIKYADTPTSGMSDNPDGKAYMGIAYNKPSQDKSSNYGDYFWSLIKGADGNVENFPDELPKVPQFTDYKSAGIGTITLRWSFEDKVYYTYEVYASKERGFSPLVKDRIFEGNNNFILFQAEPKETWYFKVRARNSHNKYTSFSTEVSVTTSKINSGNAGNIFENGSIGGTIIGDISADNITSGTIDTGVLKSNVIEAINASITNATIDKAKIGNLSADKITAGNIDADRITAGVINAINASIGSAVINEAKIGNLSANKITAGEMHGDRITAGTLEANKISTEGLNAICVKANELVADNLKTGTLKVSTASIADAHINFGKIDDVEITGAHIKEGTILNAYIEDLNAEKITSGTLDAGRVTISGTGGKLNLQDNTITISDESQVKRVQVGKDKRGEYGILVMGADGEPIFDSDKGVLNDKGLNDGVVSKDKIRDEAVGPTKLNIKEIFADEAFIGSIQTVELDAGKITTGYIEGDRIRISGIVSFEALNNDMADCFQPTEGKTYINGGMIAAHSIKANQLDVRNLSVENKKKEITFAVSDDGDITVNGLLRSANFDQSKNTGYQISTDGRAILNQAEIRGDVRLPNAGLTNYLGVYENLIDNSAFKDGKTEPWVLSGSSATLSAYADNDTERERVDPDNLALCLTNNNAEYVAQIRYKLPQLKPGVEYTYTHRLWAHPFSRVWLGIYYTNAEGSVTYTTLKDVQNTSISGFKHESFSFTPPPGSTNFSLEYWHYGKGSNSGSGKFWLLEPMFSEGKEKAWAPSTSDKFNPVRMWAGKNYADRNIAPFRVYQNGNIFANDVDLSGRLFGTIDNGNLRIDTGTLTISNGERSINEAGEVMVRMPKMYEEYVRLDGGQCSFDTNLKIGNNSIGYIKKDDALNLNLTMLRANSTYLSFELHDIGGMGGLHTYGVGGAHHYVSTSVNNGRLGALTFSGESDALGTQGDFAFTRKYYTQDCKVSVYGELQVSKKISSESHNIEMKATSEGWGFYVS